jgi:hypothetical protein
VAEAVVEEVLVDFVGDDEEVVLDGEGGDGFDLLEGEDLAAGVGGGVEDEAAVREVMAARRRAMSSDQSGASSGTERGWMRRARRVLR